MKKNKILKYQELRFLLPEGHDIVLASYYAYPMHHSVTTWHGQADQQPSVYHQQRNVSH